MAATDFADTLRSHGLRVTAPRVATLSVLAGGQHLEAEAVSAKVKELLGSVSRQAVYDALHVLSEAGLVRAIMPDNRAARYELDRHDNHHHLFCSSCGNLIDVPCAKGEVPCLTPPDAENMTIEVAEVFYHGLCPDCKSKHIGNQE